MSILTVIARPGAAAGLVAWTKLLANPEHEIEFICLEPEGQAKTLESIQEAIEESGVESANIIKISNSAPLGEILERTRKLKPRLLITDQFSFQTIGNVQSDKQNSDELVRSAPCSTIYPLSTIVDVRDIKKILLIVNQSAQDMATLRLSHNLVGKLDAELTLATIEEKSNSKAEVAGEMAIQTLVHDFGIDADTYKTKVVVDRLRHRGVRKAVGDQQLVICGYDGFRDIRPLRRSLAGKMLLVVKATTPLRLTQVSEWLPNINPRDHAELLQDLRQGSRWNSDFVSMLSLASAIASLGLLQNSPAVVIGSMLLAPLMTPMIGAGLALAQANFVLAKRCMTTILLGILLAFFISLTIGILTPSRETLSPEVLSRGSPNVLDLLIALGAAMAATIAMARPNIAGAIAGVAIATALVPPLCAVGISVAEQQFQNALGALLLFTTNLFAIIVASSITFSLMGIVTDASIPRHVVWTRQLRVIFVMLLLILSGPLTIFLYSQLEKGRPQTAAFPVTRALSRALKKRVDQDEGVDITFMARSSVVDGVIIHIASKNVIPISYADDLRAIVRREMNNPDEKVYVVCLQGHWLSMPDDMLD